MTMNMQVLLVFWCRPHKSSSPKCRETQLEHMKKKMKVL